SELGTSHLLPTYARIDLAFERGEGAWLVATNGERYLDFTSGVAVNALGHAHPHLVAAISEQAQKLWHVSNLYRIPEAERLAARLCQASFADVAFFANSGAEAMECAIKMARKYQSASGKPERFRIITFEGAFHGRRLCDDNGLLLIFDEVQTGIGRTGDLFAYQHTGVVPDIMALAKALGGGFPLGACLASAEAAKGMTAGTHGSTFGGNPLAMAAGNAVLDVVLAPGFLDRVQQTMLLLKQRLAELKDRHPAVIAEVRGEGFLIGLRALVPAAELVDALRAEH